MTGDQRRPSDESVDDAYDLFENAPCGYVVFDEAGIIQRVNLTLVRMVDSDRQSLLGKRLPALLGAASRILYETHLHPLLTVNGSVNEVALDLETGSGEVVPVLMSVVEAAETDPDSREFRAMIVDITERRRADDEIMTSSRLAERRAQRLTAIQAVSAGLSAALTPEDIATIMARTAADVLDMSDIVLWRASNEGRSLSPIRPLSPESAIYASIEDIDRRDARPHWEALRTGEPLAVRLERDADVFPETIALLKAVGHQVVRFFPFRMSAKMFGVVSVASDRPDTPDADDEAALVEVVRLVGAALERAEFYAHERNIALTWQASLMASDTPDDERVAVRSYYEPATSSFRAGGDWFEVMMVGEDQLMFVIGDVVGHGMPAAATMGQLRSAAAALAQAGLGPASVLEGLDRFATTRRGAFAATVICGDLDLESGRVRLARGGHVPPLLIGSEPTYISDGGGPPLAVSTAPRPKSHEFTIAVGERLVLVTDGLVERRDESIDVGLERLANTMASAPEMALPEAVTSVAGAEHEDDICILELSRPPLGGSAA